MSGVGTLRRYYLLKAIYWHQMGPEEDGLYLAWIGRKQEVPGTDLPADFPLLSKLAAALGKYTTVEDLKGPTQEQSVDIEELVLQGFDRKEAAAVIAAAEEL